MVHGYRTSNGDVHGLRLTAVDLARDHLAESDMDVGPNPAAGFAVFEAGEATQRSHIQGIAGRKWEVSAGGDLSEQRDQW
jgi:hypothetical protein